MRSFFVITIFFLLTACSAPSPAPTATVVILPTVTLTTIPNFTETPAFTPTVRALEIIILPESELFKLSYETQEYTFPIGEGINLDSRIVTDESGCPVVCEVRENNHFVNSAGERAEVAIPKFSFALLYEVAKHTGGTDGTGIDKDIGMTEYAQMIVEASEGMRPWSEVGVTLKDIWVSGEDLPHDVIIVPGIEQGNLPENMRGVTKVVFVRGGDFQGLEGMRPVTKEDAPAKALLNGSTLYLYSGITTELESEIRGQGDVVVKSFSRMAEFLYKTTGYSSSNDALIKILANKSGAAAVQIFNATGGMVETEAITNP